MRPTDTFELNGILCRKLFQFSPTNSIISGWMVAPKNGFVALLESSHLFSSVITGGFVNSLKGRTSQCTSALSSVLLNAAVISILMSVEWNTIKILPVLISLLHIHSNYMLCRNYLFNIARLVLRLL